MISKDKLPTKKLRLSAILVKPGAIKQHPKKEGVNDMKWYQSVRYRLLMIIATLLLSTLLVVSGTSFYFAQQYLEESIDDTENSVADNFSFR